MDLPSDSESDHHEYYVLQRINSWCEYHGNQAGPIPMILTLSNITYNGMDLDKRTCKSA